MPSQSYYIYFCLICHRSVFSALSKIICVRTFCPLFFFGIIVNNNPSKSICHYKHIWGKKVYVHWSNFTLYLYCFSCFCCKAVLVFILKTKFSFHLSPMCLSHAPFSPFFIFYAWAAGSNLSSFLIPFLYLSCHLSPSLSFLPVLSFSLDSRWGLHADRLALGKGQTYARSVPGLSLLQAADRTLTSCHLTSDLLVADLAVTQGKHYWACSVEPSSYLVKVRGSVVDHVVKKAFKKIFYMQTHNGCDQSFFLFAPLICR